MTPMSTSSQKFPLIPGIVLGALFGALALSLVISLPDLFLRAVQGKLTELTRILTSVVYDAFTTSLGAVGALVGGTVAWKKLRAHPAPEAEAEAQAAVNPEPASIWSKSWRILPWKQLHPGEAMLAWGFVFLLASFGVYPSVMTWFLALWTLPVAGVLLAIGYARSKNSSASVLRLSAGSGLLLLGLFALGMAAFFGTDLSYKLALHVQRPTSQMPNLWEGARFAGSCLIPVLLVGPGLRLWTDWSRGRCIGWCVVMLLFPVAAMLLHRTLAAIGFLALTA
jgi:hypothetical protein